MPRRRALKRTPNKIRGSLPAQRSLFYRLTRLHLAGFKILSEILDGITGWNVQIVRSRVKDFFSIWSRDFQADAMGEVLTLYSTGLKQGIAEVGLRMGANIPDLNAVSFLATQPDGLVPTLQGFVEEERQWVEEVVRKAFAGDIPMDRKDMIAAINERAPREKWRLNRIVRTESSKVAGMGRLHAWEQDPDREKYHYNWIATIDGRHKDVSAKFMREGPYTFEQVKALWTDPRATVHNRKTGKIEVQNDRFNNRCTITRRMKSQEELYAEGYSGEEVEDWI